MTQIQDQIIWLTGASSGIEVYIGKGEVLAVYLKRFFPRIFAQLVRYFVPK